MEPKGPANERGVCPTCGQAVPEKAADERETVTLTAPEGTIGVIGAPLEDESDVDPEKEASDSGSVP